MALDVTAQVPQFSSKDFEGWLYNSPVTELNQENILRNKIVLYNTTTGLRFTLTSPSFTCSRGQTIDMKVTWITDMCHSTQFVVRKVALTAALLDEDGVAVDSVTYTPSSVSVTNYVNLSITVPRGMRTARLRFAAWSADVDSHGAVRQIDMSTFLKGDVNQDGEVTVADVNAIIDVILANEADEGLRQRADVNRDSEVGLADINDVIDIIVG